jgi:hypothetical protein
MKANLLDDAVCESHVQTLLTTLKARTDRRETWYVYHATWGYLRCLLSVIPTLELLKLLNFNITWMSKPIVMKLDINIIYFHVWEDMPDEINGF